MAELVGPEGKVIALDIQEEALERTRAHLGPLASRVELCHQSHEELPQIQVNISLVVYNLGYLPGGDKSITTQAPSTLASLKKFLTIAPAVSVTCYPGHPEGAREEQELIKFFTSLSPTEWTVCHHRWINRPLSPTLFILNKINFN